MNIIINQTTSSQEATSSSTLSKLLDILDIIITLKYN